MYDDNYCFIKLPTMLYCTYVCTADIIIIVLSHRHRHSDTLMHTHKQMHTAYICIHMHIHTYKHTHRLVNIYHFVWAISKV